MKKKQLRRARKAITKISKKLPFYKYHRKKRFLFLKRNIIRFKNENFSKELIIRLRSNNVFCTFNDLKTKKTLFSCVASRYKIKITKKHLNYQITRILTFVYHEIKRILKGENFIIKINAPKFLRRKIYRWCKRFFSSFIYNGRNRYRNLFFQIKDGKAYNGCRAKKKRRKKRSRRRYFKKL